MDVEVRMDSQLSSKNNSKVVSRFCNRRIHFIGIGGCGMSGLARTGGWCHHGPSPRVAADRVLGPVGPLAVPLP